MSMIPPAPQGNKITQNQQTLVLRNLDIQYTDGINANDIEAPYGGCSDLNELFYA